MPLDFELPHWTNQPLDGDVALSIRHDVRQYRRERGRGGHRFRHSHLKSLWSVEDIHAVLNHNDDPAWQYWYHDARQGWLLVDWFSTRREAQAFVDMNPVPTIVIHGTNVDDTPIHVLAGWPDPEYPELLPKDYTMRVPCRSDYTASVVIEVFEKVGCLTRQDQFV
jgi:hypothetical protein